MIMMMKTVLFLLLGLATVKALEYGFRNDGGEVTKLLGETVSFRCEMFGLNPTMFVSWSNGSTTLFFAEIKATQDERISKTVEGETSILSIEDVSVEDEADYVCGISGVPHPVNLEFSLVVNILPTIAMEPDESKIDLVIGESTEIACRAAGKPQPEVTWTRIEGSSAEFDDGETTYSGETLSIPSVDKKHSGKYSCKATNDAGIASEEIHLNVVYAPNVTVANPVEYTAPGTEKTIECEFDANPAVRVSWQHNGDDINNNSRHIKIRNKNGVASLKFTDVKEEDLGIYRCIGANDKGEVWAVIKLTADPYGLKILNQDATSRYSDSYFLEWQVGSEAPLIDCSLDVQQVNTSGNVPVHNATIPGANVMVYKHQITGLQANGTYVYTLSCRNAYGTTPTEESEFYTSEQDRRAPPPTTTPGNVQTEENTDALQEMNTLDDTSSEDFTTVAMTTQDSVTIKYKDDPNAAPAQHIASLLLVLATTLACTW